MQDQVTIEKRLVAFRHGEGLYSDLGVIVESPVHV